MSLAAFMSLQAKYRWENQAIRVAMELRRWAMGSLHPDRVAPVVAEAREILAEMERRHEA